VLDDTLPTAPLPALLSSLALVALTAIWLTGRAGFTAGTAAALVLAGSAISVEMAVFARFYSMHALAILVALCAIFESLRTDWSRRSRLIALAVAAVALAIAFTLQITTLLATAALAVSALAVVATRRWTALHAASRRHPVLWLVAISVGILLGVAVIAHLGVVELLREAPLWAERNREVHHYYLRQLAEELPLLWPLFPLAVLGAATRHRELAIFLAVFVAVALVLQSLGAAKHMRYVYYTWPALCLLIGCAMPVARDLLKGIIDRHVSPRHSVGRILPLLFVAVVATLAIEGRRVLTGLGGDARPFDVYRMDPSWHTAVPALRPFLQRAECVVVSNSMKALYFLGDYDYELNAGIVYETDTAEDFGLDVRTGRRAIGRRSSLATILERNARVLVILERKKIGVRSGASADVIQLIQERCVSVPLPVDSGLETWFCDRDQPTARQCGSPT
jgi:hypothetical protein